MTRTLVFQCTQCHRFTLQETCPACKGKAINPLPPKFSPEDAYGAYRRKAKRMAAARGR